MPWYAYALLASVFWGIHYNIVGKTLTAVSPITVYFMPTIVLIATLPLYYETLISDYHSLMAADWSVKLSSFAVMFTSIVASVLLYKAIHSSNATLASLIEISYPVFVAIFAFLIFRENHMSWNVALGGLLIMGGTSLIIYNN